MNGMKFNLSIIFAIVLQGVALTWFLANQNSKIDTLYTEFEQQNKKEVIENQVKMKLDLQNLIADVKELQKDMKRMQSKDKEIVKQNRSIERQHKDLFKLLRDGTTPSGGYNYGD